MGCQARRRHKVAGVIVWVAVLGSCASNSPAQSGVTAPEMTPALDPGSSSPLGTAHEPLTASAPTGRRPPEEILLEIRLAPTDAQYDAWQFGATALINRCLTSQGFAAVATRPGSDERRRQWEALLDRLYFDDREAVSVLGYRFGHPDMAPVEASSAGVGEQEPDPALEQAADNCAAPIRETFSRLTTALGDGSDLSSVAVEAQGKIFAEMASAPEIAAASAALEACLVAAGYPATVVQSAPGASEPVDVALADFDCRRTTGYTEAKIAWLAAKVAEWIEQNPTVVTAVLEFNQRLADAGVNFSAG